MVGRAVLGEVARPQTHGRARRRAAVLRSAEETILGLQRAAGNAGVATLLRQTPTTTTTTGPAAQAAGGDLLPAPPELWSEDEIKDIQRQLRRLRLYSLGVDGILGRGSEQGLVEAFGGDSWRSLGPDAVLTALRGATRPGSARGQHNLRYGELFKDGVLDVTLGVGYMEEESPGKHTLYMTDLLQELDGMFSARGFHDDHGLAERLLTDAHRDVGPSAFGRFYVKQDALTYRPPAGDARSVHVVVRLLGDDTGQHGGEAAQAFEEGMTQGDVAYYTGHGRYGSGPDFDRNFLRFQLLDAEGNVTQELTDYERLERVLRRESRDGNAWRRFRWRVDHDRIRVEVSNRGNLLLAARNRHPGEFGANLIYWALEQSGNTAITGGEGRLGAEAAQAQTDRQRRYRVMVFDGCRTQDYEQHIRSTPGFDTRSADMIETNRETGFYAEAEAFMAFLEAIVGQQSAEEVVHGMNREMRAHEEGYEGAPFKGTGFGDNPSR